MYGVRVERAPFEIEVTLFTIDEGFGGWQNAQKTHFEDGSVFGKIYQFNK